MSELAHFERSPVFDGFSSNHYWLASQTLRTSSSFDSLKRVLPLTFEYPKSFNTPPFGVFPIGIRPYLDHHLTVNPPIMVVERPTHFRWVVSLRIIHCCIPNFVTVHGWLDRPLEDYSNKVSSLDFRISPSVYGVYYCASSLGWFTRTLDWWQWHRAIHNPNKWQSCRSSALCDVHNDYRTSNRNLHLDRSPFPYRVQQ